MLLDPHKSEAFLYSKEGFLSWLEAQPPERTYEWTSTRVCLCGLYLRDHGKFYDDMHEYLARIDGFDTERGIYHRLFNSPTEYIFVGSACYGMGDQNCGDALKRLRYYREGRCKWL